MGRTTLFDGLWKCPRCTLNMVQCSSNGKIEEYRCENCDLWITAEELSTNRGKKDD